MTERENYLVATIDRLMAVDVDRVATIDRLMANDVERVQTIKGLMAVDAERVAKTEGLMATVDRLLAADAQRVIDMKALSDRFYATDGLTALGRNLEFMDEPVFAAAWEKTYQANKKGWPDGVPDVRWRSAIALWAARHALHLEGDFVECGVHTGLFSLVICHALNFGSLARRFLLFDTFNGIPLEGLVGEELEHAIASNANLYIDVFAIAMENFAPFKNARLVRGELPGTLSKVDFGKISYLMMDLNIAAPEKAVISQLWERLVPGAIVLIDDYGWLACKTQYDMWNEFAKSVDHCIAPLPTGQGLLIKR